MNCAKVRVGPRRCGCSERGRDTSGGAGECRRPCCKFRALANIVWGRLIVDAELVGSAVCREKGQRNGLPWLYCKRWARLSYRRGGGTPTGRGITIEIEGRGRHGMGHKDLRNWKSRSVNGGQESDRENQFESLKLLQRTVPSLPNKDAPLPPEYLPMPEINTNLTLMY